MAPRSRMNVLHFGGSERAQWAEPAIQSPGTGKKSCELTCGRGEGCRDPAWRALGRPRWEGDGVLLGRALPDRGRRPVNVRCGVGLQRCPGRGRRSDPDTWRTFSGRCAPTPTQRCGIQRRSPKMSDVKHLLVLVGGS